ncbi:leucine-rich repeat-containing protein 24-like [Arapaima gigas]
MGSDQQESGSGTSFSPISAHLTIIVMDTWTLDFSTMDSTHLTSNANVMSTSVLTLVLLPLWGLYTPPAVGCPSVCRCYSLTVECGSMGLREFPKNIPPITQVCVPPRLHLLILSGHLSPTCSCNTMSS